MAEQGVSRKKKITFFWLRAVCFSVLTALLLTYAVYVFTPKSDYGICPIPPP